MKILIAPLHYMANNEDGSEYSRAFDYIDFLSKNRSFSGDVLVGYMDRKKMGNFQIKSFFNKKQEYISNFTRLIFTFWIYINYLKLTAKNKYDLIWHNGPFAIGQTFSLIGIFNFKKIPFIVGPIVTPHIFTGNDEVRSMGKKLEGSHNLFTKLTKIFDNYTYNLSNIFNLLSNKTLQKATIVLAKETECKNLLNKRNIKNVKIFNSGINLSKYKKINRLKTNNKINLLNVSYLVKRKKTEDLIYAVSKLVNIYKITNIHLTIVGDGPEMKILIGLTTNLGLENFVTFTGFVDKSKVFKYYSNADIFVSATMSDSMPAMYFEAMAGGLPIITYENASAKELLKSGAKIVTVKKGSINNLTKSLIKIIKNKKTIQDYGKVNKTVSERMYNFKHKMTELINLMKKL